MGNKSKKNSSRRPKAKFKGKPSWKKPKAQQHSVPLAPRGESEQPSCETFGDSNSSLPAPDGPETPRRASFEPSKSATARKLGTHLDCCAEDGSSSSRSSRVSASKSPYFQQPEPEGNIVVSLKNLKAAMELMHKCKGGHIKVVDDYSKRHGLCNSMYFECTLCKHRVYLETSEKSGHVADVNRRAAFAASEVGLGREGLSVICEIMNLPQPVSDSNFQDHSQAIHDATIKCVNSNMQEAANELRKKIMDENPEMNEDSIMDITVSFDGTWSKRGFTANFGIGFVIAAETGKVIDFVTLSKACEICKQGNKLQKDKQKYEQWKREHEASGKCQKNFTGSSSAMEKQAAKMLWSRSIEKHKFRYTNMVCDGDSKSHSEVWDTYGICDLCARYEPMNKSSPEYQAWMKTEEYKKWLTDHELDDTDCKRVNKLDCIGHVQKRMGKNLLNLTKEKKLKDGKPVGGRSGRLTRSAIDKLQKYYGKAIRRNVDKNAKTRAEVETVVSNMQTSIRAILYHSTKMANSNERHKYCPKGSDSWCLYQKDLSSKSNVKTFEDKDHHLDPVFLDFLTPVFDRLSEPRLLKRCVPGYSQNANESVNAMVWNRCPKHRSKGFASVDTAAGSATIAFNSGAQGRHAVMKNLDITPGKVTKAGSIRKDKKRVQQSIKRNDKKFQDARAKMRNAKLREEEKRRNAEGVTYQSGGFNEEILAEAAGPAPRTKRKASQNTSEAKKRKKT